MQIIAGIVRLTPRNMHSVDQAIRYIDDHYNKAIAPDDLCELFFIPVKKLHAGIRRRTGQSLHDYQEKVRIDQAKILLADHDLPIKNIAKEVGYKTSSHFGQVFKDLMDMTPQEYRRQLLFNGR